MEYIKWTAKNMTFWYVAGMDEHMSWLRRARRILSVWLLTCIIRDSDQEVTRGTSFNLTATVRVYSSAATVARAVLSDFVGSFSQTRSPS
jgi:hypothetical protein